MSDNVCPKCGKPYAYVGDVVGRLEYYVCTCKYENTFAYTYSVEDLQAEIARLKAALEKAEQECGDWKRGYGYWLDKYYRMCNARNEIMAERDEARQLARQYHEWYQELLEKMAEYNHKHGR